VVVFSILAILLSCGRLSVTYPKVTIQGKVQAGPTANAEVQISKLNEDGTVGEVLVKAFTDSEGYFSGELRDIVQNTHLLAEAKGGSYLDEGSQEIIVMAPGEVFRSIISVNGSSVILPVTPLTDMVAVSVMENWKASKNLSEAVSNFTSLVELSTGLYPNDLKYLPRSPSRSLATETPEQRLDAALTGMSSILDKLKVSPERKNAAYLKISNQVAKNGRFELPIPSELRAPEVAGDRLIPLLDSFYSDEGVGLLPIDLKFRKFNFFNTSCGAENAPLEAGQVCCEPNGCPGACTYEDPKKGESCEEEEEPDETCKAKLTEVLEGGPLANDTAVAVQAAGEPAISSESQTANSPNSMGFLDWVQVCLDAGGTVEPTPICDLANASISVCRGNFGDAGISLCGVIPYIGDAGKAGKYGAKIAKACSKVPGLKIAFGRNANQIYHTFRHIDGLVDRAKAIAKITEDLNSAADSLKPGDNIRKVIVDGIELTFNAHKLPDGTINVGRITPPRP